MKPQQEAVFRERIGRWQTAFTDPTTGIHKTLDELVWHYAAYSSAVRIVHLANQRRESGPPLNAMLFELISTGYWSGFLFGIRRLLDDAPIRGERGVYSLRAVVNDIKACLPSITRRVYVEVICDAEYDLDRLRREHWQRLQAAAAGKALWGEHDLPKSRWSHQYFDAISGVAEANRTQSDMIDPGIFAKIETRLAALDGIAKYVTSHLAHAGNKESRIGKDLADFDIRKAREALKSLKEVADLVGVWFAKEGGAGLTIPQYDQFEGLDRPIVSTEDLAELETRWREIDHDVASWSIDAEQL